MKKNGLLSDEIWAFQTFELGTSPSPAALSPESMHDTTFRDEGDPYQWADAAAVNYFRAAAAQVGFGVSHELVRQSVVAAIGAQHELVAHDFGVGGIFLERWNEGAGPAHGAAMYPAPTRGACRRRRISA